MKYDSIELLDHIDAVKRLVYYMNGYIVKMKVCYMDEVLVYIKHKGVWHEQKIR